MVAALSSAWHFLSSAMNKRRLKVFLGPSKAIERWHATQAAELRSVGGSLAWSSSQTCGNKCMEHVSEVLHSVFTPGSVAEMGFWIGHGDKLPLSPEETSLEDEFATMAGQFTLSLVFCRIGRTLQVASSWPFSAVRFLDTDVDQAM